MQISVGEKADKINFKESHQNYTIPEIAKHFSK